MSEGNCGASIFTGNVVVDIRSEINEIGRHVERVAGILSGGEGDGELSIGSIGRIEANVGNL